MFDSDLVRIKSPYLRSVLPQQLIHSLEGIKGFNRLNFEAVHASGDQLTSVRLNPQKQKLLLSDWHIQGSAYPIQYDKIPWCEHGYYLSERPSFTMDPLFHAGAYYVQEASSMFIWEILKQIVSDVTYLTVLDLCAAPGGKSTLLASWFTDGLVVCNEVIKSRASILTENITKWGALNTVVTNNDPSDFKRLENFFDLVLVDAPCSGSGLFRKDSSSIEEWSESNVALCCLRQQRILEDIFPSLKPGGLLIYSTCSYSVSEDESILEWLQEKFDVESLKLDLQQEWNIVETQSNNGQGYGYRFYPDRLKGEGFFITVCRKKEDSFSPTCREQPLQLPSKSELQQIRSFILLPESISIFKQLEFFRAFPANWLKELQQLAKHLYIKKAGGEIGTIKGKDFIPSHELAVSQLTLQSFRSIELNREEALLYLKRKEIKITGEKGWTLVTHCGLPLGWIKVLPNRVNNYYPTEWRILKE